MSSTREMPLGKIFSQLAKDYVGTFTKRLEDLPIKRYFYPLVLIHEADGKLSQSSLADELFVDKVSVVRIIDYLSEKKCVMRRKNPADRREHLLELTSEGRKLVPKIRQAMIETNALSLNHLNSLDVEALESALSRIACNLKQQPQDSYKVEFIKDEK